MQEFKKGDFVRIKPEWRSPDEPDEVYIITSDPNPDTGRCYIKTAVPNPNMHFQPQSPAGVNMLIHLGDNVENYFKKESYRNVSRAIKQLSEELNESAIKKVYLVYERQYVTGESRENDDIIENIREWANIYTEKTLIEYAEDKRQDFIEMENYSEPIVNLDMALSFFDMAEYEVIEMSLID